MDFRVKEIAHSLRVTEEVGEDIYTLLEMLQIFSETVQNIWRCTKDTATCISEQSMYRQDLKLYIFWSIINTFLDYFLCYFGIMHINSKLHLKSCD